MPAIMRELVAHGLPGETPAAAIHTGTTGRQATVVVKVQPPSPEEAALLEPGSVLVSLLPIAERETQIEAPRARLLEQVAAWDPGAFVRACLARVEGFAAEAPTDELADYLALIRTADAPTASFVASVAAVAARGTKRAFSEERAWQARWLARALDLREV